MQKVGFVLFILFFLQFAGCDDFGGNGVCTDESPSRIVMGTFARSIAVAADKNTAKTANKTAFEKLVEIDEMMSDYLDDSELSIVNKQAFDNPIKVSDELFGVLEKAIEYSRISGGAFDVTIGPVVDLWHKAGEKKVKPTDEEIAAAKTKVGYDKLILDKEKKTVRFTVEGMRLDLGAIAKGYGIDKTAETMQAAGATGGMVDVGGDIQCFGKPAKKDKWAIGLQNPKEGEDFLKVIELGDNGVATSGDYLRFVVLDGEKFSHIMAPKKGSSAKGLSSVTIIGSNAMDSDAMATTVTVMGIEKGLELVESIEGMEGFVVPSDPNEKKRYSSGFDKFVRKE